MYGKMCIFAFAALVGGAHGGVVVGLAMCGVMLAAASTAATLMQVGRVSGMHPAGSVCPRVRLLVCPLQGAHRE